MPEDLLPFYQQFFTDNLFLVPETASGVAAATQTVPDKPATVTYPEDATMGDTMAPKRFTILGDNKKGLVLLFSLSEKDFAALPQNVFLTKILAAIQHMSTDVAFVNLEPGFKLNIFDLSKETKLQQVVAFGQDLVDLAPGFNIQLYKPAAIGQVPLLLAEPLYQIENDVNRKKYLWSGLQAIFIK